MSWSDGFLRMGVRWSQGWRGPYRPWGCCGGWYGGGYRRGPTFVNTGTVSIGNSVSIGNRGNIANWLDAERLTGSNLYERPENRARIADRTTATRHLKLARAASGRSNDVFADKSSIVTRRSADNWQVRDKGQWRDAGAGASQTGGQVVPQIDHSDLDRAHTARRQGTHRERERLMRDRVAER